NPSVRGNHAEIWSKSGHALLERRVLDSLWLQDGNTALDRDRLGDCRLHAMPATARSIGLRHQRDYLLIRIQEPDEAGDGESGSTEINDSQAVLDYHRPERCSFWIFR